MSSDLRAKILLVDDEPEIRSIVRSYLEGITDRFEEVGTGNDALQKIEWDPPQLIISDYRMPGLNGLELLRFIESRRLRIPIILLSGYLDRENSRDAWRAGAFEILEKPIDFDRLEQSVKSALVFGQSFSGNSGSENILNRAAYDQIQLFLPKVEYASLEARALEQGLSVSSFIIRLIHEELNSKSLTPASKHSLSKI